MAITPIGGNEDSSDIVAEINITPLTDIFLVLLIIFMITSSAMIESGGKVNLPKAVATQSESRGTTVTITPKHEIYVDQKIIKEFDRPFYPKLIADTPKDPPLPAQKMVFAFQKWDQQIGANVGK